MSEHRTPFDVEKYMLSFPLVPWKKGDVEKYILSFPLVPWKKGDFTVRVTCEPSAFRATHLKTQVGEEGVVTLRALMVGKLNVLASSVDAFHYDGDEDARVKSHFYEDLKKRYQLADDKALDEFLDRKEISAPDMCRVDLPTAPRGYIFTIEGTILAESELRRELFLMLVGVAQR